MSNQNEGYLRDELWRCMVRDIREALESKLGSERITQISSSQLMVEIERISFQKQCDILNRIKLFKARQETGETIRGFEHRLRTLAYACNFPVMVRGMANVMPRLHSLQRWNRCHWVTQSHLSQ